MATDLAQVGYENYYQMLSDKLRMDAYRQAIFKSVKAGDVIVDLGAGTGLLGIWAIQAGASRVYAIEKTDAIHLAKEIAQANGCLDKIEFINENSMDVDLPERADILLSETLGSFAIDENTIQFVNDARERFLKKDGVIIPSSVEIFVAPVEDAAVYHKIDFWRHIPDIDFSPAFNVFSKKIMVESISPDALLSPPVSIGKIDFDCRPEENFRARVYLQMQKAGHLHGVAGWFCARLYDDIQINTSPHNPLTHWKQAFFPFENPIEVIKGDVLDWSVAVEARDKNSDDTRIHYEYRCTQLKNEQAPVRQAVGRNDKCPCGSGKKYKKCCMP